MMKTAGSSRKFPSPAIGDVMKSDVIARNEVIVTKFEFIPRVGFI